MTDKKEDESLATMEEVWRYLRLTHIGDQKFWKCLNLLTAAAQHHSEVLKLLKAFQDSGSDDRDGDNVFGPEIDGEKFFAAWEAVKKAGLFPEEKER